MWPRRAEPQPHLATERVPCLACLQGTKEDHCTLPVHCPLSLEQTWAGCGGPAANFPASRGLMVWRDAHLGKGACQPHLLAGWGLLPVFLPGQAGRSPVPGLWARQSDTVRGEGQGLKVSSGSDSRREDGAFLKSERLRPLPLLAL